MGIRYLYTTHRKEIPLLGYEFCVRKGIPAVTDVARVNML